MRQNNRNTPSEFEEKIIQVNRVSKKTKGGNQIGFSVLVVVGDRKGKVGVALGKGPDVLSSIKKSVRRAKKRFIEVPMKNKTIPFAVRVEYGAATILLKPAPRGSGIIAGGAVRSVVEVAGIRDVVGKVLGSNNQANNAYATFKALQEIRKLMVVKGLHFNNRVKPAENVIQAVISPTLPAVKEKAGAIIPAKPAAPVKTKTLGQSRKKK